MSFSASTNVRIDNVRIDDEASPKRAAHVFPSIRFTTRLAENTLNTMAAESSTWPGPGSQLRNLNRWGDYSSMSVDPVDGCTFWYTNQYQKTDGTFNWSTRIHEFQDDR
jgi:hypothetical protein